MGHPKMQCEKKGYMFGPFWTLLSILKIQYRPNIYRTYVFPTSSNTVYWGSRTFSKRWHLRHREFLGSSWLSTTSFGQKWALALPRCFAG